MLHCAHGRSTNESRCSAETQPGFKTRKYHPVRPDFKTNRGRSSRRQRLASFQHGPRGCDTSRIDVPTSYTSPRNSVCSVRPRTEKFSPNAPGPQSLKPTVLDQAAKWSADYTQIA